MENVKGDVIIWTMGDCIVCEEVKDLIKDGGSNFEERSCSDLVNGKETILKAVRQFVKQKQSAPVLMVGSEMVEPLGYIEWSKSK